MSWKTAAAAMSASAIRTFGEEVIFSPKAGGGPHTIAHVVFDDDYQAVDPDTGVTVSSGKPALGVRTADLPTSPAHGDEWEVRGKAYRATDVQADSEGVTLIFLHELE